MFMNSGQRTLDDPGIQAVFAPPVYITESALMLESNSIIFHYTPALLDHPAIQGHLNAMPVMPIYASLVCSNPKNSRSSCDISNVFKSSICQLHCHVQQIWANAAIVTALFLHHNLESTTSS
jgi:hypothetical protein